MGEGLERWVVAVAGQWGPIEKEEVEAARLGVLLVEGCCVSDGVDE